MLAADTIKAPLRRTGQGALIREAGVYFFGVMADVMPVRTPWMS